MMHPYAMSSPPDDVEGITAARMRDQALTEGHAPAIASYEAIKARTARIISAIMESAA